MNNEPVDNPLITYLDQAGKKNLYPRGMGFLNRKEEKY